jgi:hypothetical protein
VHVTYYLNSLGHTQYGTDTQVLFIDEITAIVDPSDKVSTTGNLCDIA